MSFPFREAYFVKHNKEFCWKELQWQVWNIDSSSDRLTMYSRFVTSLYILPEIAISSIGIDNR